MISSSPQAFSGSPGLLGQEILTDAICDGSWTGLTMPQISLLISQSALFCKVCHNAAILNFLRKQRGHLPFPPIKQIHIQLLHLASGSVIQWLALFHVCDDEKCELGWLSVHAAESRAAALILPLFIIYIFNDLIDIMCC